MPCDGELFAIYGIAGDYFATIQKFYVNCACYSLYCISVLSIAVRYIIDFDIDSWDPSKLILCQFEFLRCCGIPDHTVRLSSQAPPQLNILRDAVNEGTCGQGLFFHTFRYLYLQTPLSESYPSISTIYIISGEKDL